MKIIKQLLLLLCSIVLGIAPWSQSLETTQAMFQHPNYWVGLTIIAGILLAWAGQSPIKPKQQ